MGAPAGYHLFVAGAKLTAAQMNTYVMDQVIPVFATTTARDAALTAPAAGQFAAITADNQLAYYMGSAWTGPWLKRYVEIVSTNATSGTTATLDLANGNVFDVTLTGNCTFTFSNPVASGNCSTITLCLRQDGTGSRSVTWPASVHWAGGVAPTVTATASKVDWFTFITLNGGTTWFGFTGGQNYTA